MAKSARTARIQESAGATPGGSITSISAQQKSRSRVNIEIDGEYAFSLHLDVLISEELAAGQVLSADQVIEICQKDDFHLARNLAFHFISYRPRSVVEVRRRLKKADYNIAIIERVISRLLELNMLDDAEFAIEFVQGRLRNKGYGPRRLKQDLKQRGVQDVLIDRALEDAFSGLNTAELALTAGQKIFPRLAKIQATHIRRKKLSDYLTRRGFVYEHMHLAIKKLEEHVKSLNY
jgi:regulatory protein